MIELSLRGAAHSTGTMDNRISTVHQAIQTILVSQIALNELCFLEGGQRQLPRAANQCTKGVVVACQLPAD